MYKIMTQDYGVGLNTNYAKLFSVYSSMLSGENFYNDVQMIFNLINISSTGSKGDKERFLFTYHNINGVTLQRLSKTSKRIEVGYSLDNGQITVFTKGGAVGGRTYLDIEYVSNESYFIFYDLSSFTFTPTNYLESTITNDYNVNLSNTPLETFKIDLKTNLYNEIAKCVNYTSGKPTFSLSFLLMEIPTGTLTGMQYIINVSVIGDTVKVNKISGYEVSNRIEVVVGRNADNSISVYINSSAYGSFLIYPITYFTTNSYINYITTNTSIENVGTILKSGFLKGDTRWDNTTNKPIWFNGTDWIFSDGTIVP